MFNMTMGQVYVDDVLGFVVCCHHTQTYHSEARPSSVLLAAGWFP